MFEDLLLPGPLLFFVALMEIVGMVLGPSALILTLLPPESRFVSLPVPSLVFALLGTGGRPVTSVIFATLLGVAVRHFISTALMARVP
jgi:hypothetical protein